MIIAVGASLIIGAAMSVLVSSNASRNALFESNVEALAALKEASYSGKCAEKSNDCMGVAPDGNLVWAPGHMGPASDIKCTTVKVN